MSSCLSIEQHLNHERAICQERTGAPTQVLLVEDNPGDACLIAELLREAGVDAFTLSHVSSLADAFQTLSKTSVDVMLLDLSLPDSSGLDTVRLANKHAPDVPIVVMTGLNDGELALNAVQEGVQDFLVKGDTESEWLARCIRYAIERKRGQQILAKKNQELQEKNANLQQLTFAMTHDLQTPLASLVGAVDILRACIDSDDGAVVREWLTRIDASALRMMEMLDHLHVFSKAGLDTLECSPLELGSIVHSVIDDTRAWTSEHHVTVECDMNDVHILGDKEAAHRIFANLISNAIKYAPDDGSGHVQISTADCGDCIRVQIDDNGPGIPPAQLDDVFIAFRRANKAKPGTGLGLAIVARYVERLGGRTWLESDGSSGTSAIVELPKPALITKECAA